jgi:hypothetical protein
MVKWEMWDPERPGGHPRWTSLITSSSFAESPPFICRLDDSLLSPIEDTNPSNNKCPNFSFLTASAPLSLVIVTVTATATKG